MVFFDLPADETLPPEALRILKDQRKLLGIERIVPTWQTYGRHSRQGLAEAWYALDDLPGLPSR